MNPTDVVEAQFMSSAQLQAVRDRIVVDKLTLRQAVLSLYPNFNVNNVSNMQELETNLINTYAEMASALRVADLQDRIKKRKRVEDNLRSKYSLPTDLIDVRINWEKIPANLNNFRSIKRRASELFNYTIETERLRRIRSREEKTL